MKPTHIRAFEIKGTRFHLTDRGDGRLQVTSIHPYDETEYHWAVQADKSTWHIFRNGRRQRVLTADTPEAVAAELLNMDAAEQLTPKTAIW